MIKTVLRIYSVGVMSVSYSRIFGSKIFLSTELQKKEVYDKIVADGYVWIKQIYTTNFQTMLRFPTVGCKVEVSRCPFVRSVRIDSQNGKKLINKKCYF